MKELTMENAFELDECIVLELQKLPGVEGCTSRIEGVKAVTALKGLALLTQELAEVMCVPVEYVLCQITTVLLAPKAETEK